MFVQGVLKNAFDLIHFLSNRTQNAICRELTKIKERKCQQLTVQTQMVEVLPSVCNRGFDKLQRVEFNPLHSSMIKAGSSNAVCVVCTHMYS